MPRLGSGFEQLEPVLELRDTKRELLELFASRETRLAECLLHDVAASSTELPGLATPVRERLANRRTHLFAVDPKPSGKLVRKLIGSVDALRCPPDTGEKELRKRT